MDIREYIESGVLELYAMGALPQEEANSVAEALARHPELRAELAEISAALQALSPVQGKGPRPELRDKILASLPEQSAEPASGNPRPGGDNVIPMDGAAPRASASGASRYLLAASLVGFLVSASAALWLWSELSKTEEHLARNQALFEQTLDACNRAEQELHTLRNYHNHQVRMTSTGRMPGALAIVYWNPETKEVYLDPALMPQLPEGHQYQLWAIADGDSVNAGVFDPATPGHMPGLHRMHNVHEVKTFAVTVEPRGGSPAPTLSAMAVSGEL